MTYIESGAEEVEVMDGDLAELLEAVEAQIADVSREDVVSSLEDEAGAEARRVYARLQEVTLPSGPAEDDPDASMDSFVG